MPEDVLKHLGSCMRKFRNERGLTQEQLSNKANVSVRQIAKIEKGVMNPSFEILQALVTCLGVSPDILFYPELSDAERECKQLNGYYEACPPGDRGLIMKTVQCLAYELMDRSETTNEDERA